MRLAVATADDLDAMQAYLAAHGDTCMFLRSNLAIAGLAYEGRTYQGQYVVAWNGGAVAGVAAHYWNDMLLVQADQPAELARFAVGVSSRRVKGMTGATAQVRAVQAALGLSGPTQLDHDETLMSLSLDALVVPRGVDAVRRATPGDRDVVARWRGDYGVETGGEPDVATARTQGAAWFDRVIQREPPWLATQGGEPRSMCAFNARVPDTVQVGGVYTPPEHRNQGHARAVVAGALLHARAQGATRSILFTPRPDAVAAYRAIGFAPIGQFTVVQYA